MKNLFKKGVMSSEKRPKEEAKSEGNNSDVEEEFRGEIMRAIQEEERKILKKEDDVLSESDMSSLPSQMSNLWPPSSNPRTCVNNNQLTLVEEDEYCFNELWMTKKVDLKSNNMAKID